MLQKYVRLADAVNHDHTEHGDWATGQNYIVGDILQNDGGSYYCKLQHLSAAENEPGAGASWTTYWRIFAQGLKGDKGDTGAKGDKGDTGAPGTPLGSVVWKGTYDAGTTYAAGDGCVSSDVAYVSIQNNNLNHAPPDASWWAPLGGSFPGLGAAQGDILYRDASEWARLAAATRGQAFITGGASANPLYIDYHSDIYRQLLINGGFQINQQAVSPYTSATTPDNSDDSYAAPDQWILLSDGNDIVDVYQKTTFLPPGAAAALLLEVETAGKKFGILQIVESKDAIKYAGQVASLQFKARTTTGKIIRNIRAAILSWTGTADAVTSDVVSAWNAEGQNPAWAANWTAENTPGNLALVADAWTTYRIENINIDTAGMTNLAVFIWCNDADAAIDDLLYLADVQLNVGPVCLPYMPRSFADELHRCMRFYQKSYVYATAPGTITQVGNRYSIAASSYTFYDAMVPLLVPMAKTPSVTPYSTATGAANNIYRAGIGDVAATTSDQSEVSFLVNLGGGGVVGASYRVQWVADARL